MKGATKYQSIASLALFSFLLCFNTSCRNSLFKVKPVSKLPALPSSAANANVGTLTFRAAPLLNDEETQELFESNLQLAGLLPVRVEIIHNSGEAMDLKKLRFHLHDGSNAEWKMISAKQAISRILKANGVFTYNPESRKTFEKEFRAYELDLKTPLAHSEGKRQGFVVFQTARKGPVTSPKNLILTIEGVAQPVFLKLN